MELKGDAEYRQQQSGFQGPTRHQGVGSITEGFDAATGAWKPLYHSQYGGAGGESGAGGISGQTFDNTGLQYIQGNPEETLAMKLIKGAALGFATGGMGMGLGEAAGYGAGAAGGGGAAAGGEALGTGLSASPGSSAALGAGAPVEGYALGGGITPGVASGSIGGGSLGTGIGYGAGAGGSLGALGIDSLGFSPAATADYSLPASSASPATPAAASPSTQLGTGLRAPAEASVTTPAGAPAAGGGAAQAPATAEMSFTDSLLKQMKDNALTLGLMGAGTAASLSAGKGQMPNEATMQGMGADAAAVSKQLIAQYQSGNLAPGQKAGLDQLTQNTKNQLRQYFASIGQADSTAAAQAMAQVDATALEMKQQMLDTALQQGLSAIGVAQGPLNTIAQYQLGQDQQLKQAFGNFAGGMGMLMGRNSGTPTPPKSSVQTPQQISSIQQPPKP